MAECLHCQINELVKAHLENDDPVDVDDLVARIVESAAELIADVVPAEEQAAVLATAISHQCVADDCSPNAPVFSR